MMTSPNFHRLGILVVLLTLLITSLACGINSPGNLPAEESGAPSSAEQPADLDSDENLGGISPDEPTPELPWYLQAGSELDESSGEGNESSPAQLSAEELDALYKNAPDSANLPAEIGLTRAQPYATYTLVHTEYWDFQIQEVRRGAAAWAKISADNPNIEPPPEGWEYVAVRLWVRSKFTDARGQDIDLNELSITGSYQLVHRDQLMDYPFPEILYADIYSAMRVEGWIDALVPVDETDLILVWDTVDETESQSEPLRTTRFVALEPQASMVTPPDLAGLARNDLGGTATSPAPLGNLVISPDWELSVLDVERGAPAWERVLQARSSNQEPETGQEYITARMRLRYIGSSEQPQYISQASFAAAGPQGEVYNNKTISISPDQVTNWMQVGFFPGGSYEGWIAVLAAKDEPGVLLIFQPGKYGSEAREINTRFLALE